MADLIPALLPLAAGAIGGHLVYGRYYKAALKRVVDAANDPHNRDLSRALDDADELLGRRR